ncbi:hypothetical protein GSI_11145 [Ganoderma sinense ZZ0214-1]|uniref:Uncharacterized protein n=1 Tax=Ganoderma sinense ZZ0214-1 TaxID=1077348 RepID=A0A2G8RYY5_9APHY|nr:hypothetical protein GSI_11145 [Ganoderma sinense ZZ0214-1]
MKLSQMRLQPRRKDGSFPPRPTSTSALSATLSVLPHVLATAKLPALPLTIKGPKWTASRFEDFTPRSTSDTSALVSRTRTRTVSADSTPRPATTEETVLDPDNLEPILSQPIRLDASPQARERRHRSDVNKARHRPVSNPENKPSRAQSRKVGALTSNFVLDRPRGPAATSASGSRVLKPLSELRMPVLTNDSDDLGGYGAAGTGGDGDRGEEDIESFSESEDEADRRRGPKRRRFL